MKNLLFLILGLLILSSGFAQKPKMNFEEVLEDHQLKSIQTILYKTENPEGDSGTVAYSLLFDKAGRITEEFNLVFWDVVDYSFTKSNFYNASGDLISYIRTQKYYQNPEKPLSYSPGSPHNSHSVITYNSAHQKIKEEIYEVEGLTFDKANGPSRTKVFAYDGKGRLIKETSSTPNKSAGWENYEVTYVYDDKDRKTKESWLYTTEEDGSPEVTEFVYNESGEIAEIKIHDRHSSKYDIHLKYEFNEHGKVSKMMKSQGQNSIWETTKTFTFDDKGQLIQENDDTFFYYNENGLIQQELWKSPGGEHIVNFITTYEFYD